MKKRHKFYIVDDDRISINLMTRYLEKDGHTVSGNTSSIKALQEIIAQQPDCVILDLMMPEIDGLELISLLRSKRSLDETKIVVVTAKPYEFDRKQAFSFGADGYIVKPVNPKTFVAQLLRTIADQIELAFWGVHGTLPVPSKNTIKYGGNTSCVSLDFSDNTLFIFDAGTGIKSLSDSLVAENRHLIDAKIFISHPHWDHINAMPFFAPLFKQGNEIEICGPSHGDITMEQMISGQMDGIYFPIKIKEFSARISFRDIKEETLEICGKTLKTMLLNHPGYCLGYRVEYKGRSICYITDNELYPTDSQSFNRFYRKRLINFIKGADVLITDTTYQDSEYKNKIGWGHSAVGQVANLADKAAVKTLYLFHHDTDQTDADVDLKLETAQALLAKKKSSTRCVAPKEKERFMI
ncbi:MAG: response regulator [Desulfobacterales bacterium]|nr:response regulator [Desulfobacterales bacterium]